MNSKWRKSSQSTNQGGARIEVSALHDAIGVRDSKNPYTGHLTLRTEQFTALIHRIKDNDLDL